MPGADQIQTRGHRLLNLSEAGRVLGVSARTIDRYLKTGKIATVRLPGNHRRVDTRDLDQLIANSKTEAAR